MSSFDINPFTGLPDFTGQGGGGGGDGIKTINKRGPDSSGNFQIQGTDLPNATEGSAGASSLASSDETIKGEVATKIVTPKTLGDKLGEQTEGKFYQGQGKDKPGKWVDIPIPPTPSFVPMPIKRFSSSTVAEANHCYVLTDPTTETPAPIQLPERGSFKTNDEIEIVNLSGTTFKVTLKYGGDDIIRFDNQTIESIDGKFLLSGGPGSFIRLKAENSQLWFVINRNRVTVSAGG